jgi:pimeloyl-ACP methyl ester carboxylesterase
MTDGTVMISVGRHQLAARVFGEGSPAVVIEPSFGGAAEDWERIARTLAQETTVVTYDRAPYGASSAARDARTPRDIAADLDGLLRALGVNGREWRSFRRVTDAAPALSAAGLGDRPLVVLTCAPGDPSGPDRMYQAWYDLHRDLAGLSANSRHVLSDSPDHYLHLGDPDLVATAIRDVVRCARSGARLADAERAVPVVASRGDSPDEVASDAD